MALFSSHSAENSRISLLLNKILREINFDYLEAPKITTLAILAALNFEFVGILDIFIFGIFPKIKIQNLQKSISRKNQWQENC